MLNIFENNLPRRMRFGRGICAELPGELRRLGRTQPFIVTDLGVKRAGILQGVAGALTAAGMTPCVFDAAEPEPPFSCVAAAVGAARVSGRTIDCVIALGGGSVMDTAKLVAATLLDGRDASLLAGIGKVGQRPLPLVC